MSQAPANATTVQYADNCEYRYRDAFKAFVGRGELLLEFANINRSNPKEITISDRIVLSLPNAIRLVQHLQLELNHAREKLEAEANGGSGRQASPTS